MNNDYYKKCQGCKYYNFDVYEELCSHDEETFDPETCYEEEIYWKNPEQFLPFLDGQGRTVWKSV